MQSEVCATPGMQRRVEGSGVGGLGFRVEYRSSLIIRFRDEVGTLRATAMSSTSLQRKYSKRAPGTNTRTFSVEG
jgi:hypothetical protein